MAVCKICFKWPASCNWICLSIAKGSAQAKLKVRYSCRYFCDNCLADTCYDMCMMFQTWTSSLMYRYSLLHLKTWKLNKCLTGLNFGISELNFIWKAIWQVTSPVLYFQMIKRWRFTSSFNYSIFYFSLCLPSKRVKCSPWHSKFSKIFPGEHAPGPP